MSIDKATPGPWTVRSRTNGRDSEIVDCFVEAPDVNGFAFKAEVLGDDEYRDPEENETGNNGIERKLADCHLISAAHEMHDALQMALTGRAESDPVTIQMRQALAKAAGKVA